jgi:hypothetical protein
MTLQDSRANKSLQTITLEYVTTGPFDGETIAPVISLDPTSPNYVEPDPVDQIYRLILPPGQALGLIDLSLAFNGGAGAIGDRYVRWIVTGNTVGSVSFVNGILGVYDDLPRQLQPLGSPLLLEIIRTLNGVSGIIDRSCGFVPQGSYLGISGLAAPPSGSNIIRLYVQVPQSDWDAALVENSCCCDDGGGSPDGDCPVILDISPIEIGVPSTLTIFGTGFREGLAIEAIRNPPDPPTPATLGTFSIVDGNTATVDVISPTPDGSYTLRIFDPADPEACSGSGEFTVGDGCAQFADENPVIPNSIAAGAPPLNMIVNGASLLNVISVEIRDSGGNPLVNQPAFSFALQTNTQIDTGAIAIPLVPPQLGTIALLPANPFECGEVVFPLLIT